MFKNPANYSIDEMQEIIGVRMKIYVGDIETYEIDDVFIGTIISYTQSNYGTPNVFSVKIKKDDDTTTFYNISELRKFEEIND